jgi:hypothetical protein
MTGWYSAGLRLLCEVAGEAPDLYEDSVIVLRAQSGDEALARAEVIGRESEHSYLNESGELVAWKFDRVIDVQDLSCDDLVDGMEVYSRMNWVSSGASPLGRGHHGK